MPGNSRLKKKALIYLTNADFEIRLRKFFAECVGEFFQQVKVALSEKAANLFEFGTVIPVKSTDIITKTEK